MRFTSRGRITLLRDGVAVSTHVVAEEAYEHAYAHALANGPGKYTVRYPDREVDLSTLTRVVLETIASQSVNPVSASAIDHSWTANPRAASYRVYRNGVLIASPTTNSYQHTGLAASTAYTFSVSPVSATTGEGPQTAGVQGTTLAAPDTVAPTAPVITASATGQNTASVALTTPATDSGSGVANYDLEYKTAAAASYSVITPVTAGQFPYVIGSLAAGTAHNSRARARDNAGNVGPYSAVSNFTTQAGTGTAYPWYPALDLATIPWHASSGPWGPAVPVQAPAAPTITQSDVNWTTAGASVSVSGQTGRRFIVGANLGNISISNSSDCDIIIPSGFTCNVMFINGACSRIRVRGSTVGTHSGGQVRRVDIYQDGSAITDLIFDGFKIASSNSAFEHSIVITGRPERFAIVNCKIRSARATFIGRALHIVWAGNSIQSGVITSGQAEGATGVDEAQWTIRHDTEGPVVLYANDIRGRKYHRFRTGANTAQEAATTLHYIARNQIVDEQESAITLVLGATSSPATIITDNDIHAYVGSGGGARFDAEKALYARITNNRIRSNAITAGFLSGRAAAHVANLPGANVDYSTGNTFAGWSRPSSWIGAGDPSDVSMLPAPILNATWHAQDLVGLAP